MSKEDHWSDSSKETQNSDEDILDELTEEEREGICMAFKLLDINGEGVMDCKTLTEFLISIGRLPMEDELTDILSYSEFTVEGTPKLNFDGFHNYISRQLRDTKDERKLLKSFEVFDSSPPTGKLNLTDLRQSLKNTEMKLTDDEIDYLFREEDYWMLDDKNSFAYQELIDKILDKPTCRSKFLGC